MYTICVALPLLLCLKPTENTEWISWLNYVITLLRTSGTGFEDQLWNTSEQICEIRLRERSYYILASLRF